MTVSVYQYFDSIGRLLYVGVTARNIRRSREHAETKVWWPLATGSVIEHFDTRTEALERERALIEHFSPPYNTVHNAHKVASLAAFEASTTGGKAAKLAAASAKKARICVGCGIRPCAHSDRLYCTLCQEEADLKYARMTNVAGRVGESASRAPTEVTAPDVLEGESP